jgi:hypothetical protein
MTITASPEVCTAMRHTHGKLPEPSSGKTWPTQVSEISRSSSCRLAENRALCHRRGRKASSLRVSSRRSGVAVSTLAYRRSGEAGAVPERNIAHATRRGHQFAGLADAVNRRTSAQGDCGPEEHGTP